jgi:23S rRNA pseudouridine1911/1915/1917 synthase
LRIPITQDDVGQRLDKLVAQRVPGLGRAGAKRLFAEGRVRVAPSDAEGVHARRAAKGDVAAVGQVVVVEVDEEASTTALADPEAPLTVVLETDRLLVLDKPAGQPTAPLQPAERGALANALVARYPEVASCGFSAREPGLCHRLDTDTSGLLIAARDAAAWEALVGALKAGRIDKRYLLVCSAEGLPESGTIDVPLAPHPKDRRRVLACVHPRDVAREKPRPASTRFRVVRPLEGGLVLVEATAPRALRHQIRAHFAAIDHPLLGDALYGGAADPRIARHALHAARIAFGGDAVIPAFTVTSELPEDMARLAPPP